MIAGLRQADKNLFSKPDLISLFVLIPWEAKSDIIIGYRQHLRVVGNSMAGSISEGDLVIFKTRNLNLEIGDIVVAFHPTIKSKLIIKRIYKIYQNKFDLRGDNHFSSTDSREWGLIKLDLILGKVEKVFRK